jgi:KipI family sensor histidine kinase inhibitor
MDEALATPRLPKPRTLIPAGSVGIAGKQTGAYSIDSPGGWQLIGRTPLRLFDPNDEETPTLIDAGGWIRFRSVSEEEYRGIERDVNADKYRPERFAE